MTDGIPGNALTPPRQTLTGNSGELKLTTLPMPYGSAGSGNAVFPSGFAIPTNCPNVPTAAAFIDFFTNDLEAGRSFESDNGAATNQKVLQEQSTTRHCRAEEARTELYRRSSPTIRRHRLPPGYKATFE